MSPMKTVLAAGAAALFALPALAGDIMINDAYARASGMNAKAGAAFFQIMNHGAEDDRLIAAKSDASKRVELHTHKDMGDGVMKMMEVEEGFAIAAGGMHALQRGGDHVMFMGLNEPFVDGGTVTVTLVFEKAGEMTVEIPVDLKRNPMGGGMQHGKPEDGKMGEGHGATHQGGTKTN
ncbi:copper chaperone PCu(A)C [Aliiroseovarius sp. F20344]|uniref:copper chaperone PCu(A)C n=1 Tax=Aliiroseovarius sp. F20344 TaxID=2926414 RepID=UPI001FF2D8F9|nr:copper chaperone PCu(A)C [Aliiroseovarius sp. F20344]MCK0141654.1 copper chaperone PCu(A)C [Aliiroseovarius sp. F20344]